MRWVECDENWLAIGYRKTLPNPEKLGVGSVVEIYPERHTYQLSLLKRAARGR